MADVTVKQLAAAVGVPVERLLTQIKEAGLPISDETHVINQEQKKVLLNYLKTSHATGQNKNPERITLKRKSLSQVTSPDSLGQKTVNIEVRKKRVFVKKATENESEKNIEPEIEEIAVALEPQVQETPQDITAVEITSESTPSERSENHEMNAVVDSAVVKDEAASFEKKEAVKPKTDAVHKPVKKKSHGEEENEDQNAFRHQKNSKKKVSHHVIIDDASEQEGFGHARRFKPKKRKNVEKSDKYREAEESLKHGFAMPTTPLVHEVIIPETITVADLAKKMSVKAPGK